MNNSITIIENMTLSKMKLLLLKILNQTEKFCSTFILSIEIEKET